MGEVKHTWAVITANMAQEWMFGPFKKSTHMSLSFFFGGEKYFSVFCMPLLTLQPSLAEDLKCTGLGSVRIPLTQIRGFSPQLEGQVRSLHCNIENSQFRQHRTYHLKKLQVLCLFKVPLPENYPQWKYIKQPA